MSGRTKHKWRGSDHLSSKNQKKKSRKRSTSASSDCVIVTSNRNSSVKDKRSKPQKRKGRSSSSTSNSSDSFIGGIKLDSQSHQLLGERPEFCKNRASSRANNGVGVCLRTSDRLGVHSSKEHCKEKPNKVNSRERFPVIERRVHCALTKQKERGRRKVKEHVDSMGLTKKLNKSHKRRRSSSCSSYSSDSSSSRSSSCNSGSSSRSSSTSSSHERWKRQRKRKKLAKKMKQAEKKRRKERRKLKKNKEKSREPVKEIKRNMAELVQDRLLKDINLELADRARVMTPMTREEWEKKQSVIRRVYDGETGRHRLIKGDGEILEEIVSRNRHIEINRQATKGDGAFFNARLGVNK